MPDQDTQKLDNGDAEPKAGTAPDSSKLHLWSGRGVQFWLFCVLLVLALVGMGLTQATEGGGALYWLVVLWVYVVLSLVRAWLQARKRHGSIWSEIHLHLFHWLGALVALYIIFGLERHDILSRDAASNVSMVILALSSYLAGLHFERMFVLIGIILAIMAVVGAVVEQYTLWMIIVPTSLVAAWLFLKSRHSQKDS
ncbi:MAG: hypothetical protein LJE91_06620 [Gammaproteobacteria bacterium]|jgi:hypothetical protein|nr:hypothetical protein [Gammaproteobacteria bacterium]